MFFFFFYQTSCRSEPPLQLRERTSAEGLNSLSEKPADAVVVGQFQRVHDQDAGPVETTAAR